MQKAAKLPAMARFIVRLSALRSYRFSAPFEREIFFVAAIGLSAFYLTALSSFSPHDPSGIAASFPPKISHNLAGEVGALLSGFTIFTLGLVSWILPLPLLTSAILVVKKSPKALAISRTISWCIALAGVATFLAIKFPTFKIAGFELPSGGTLGTTFGHFLSRWLGPVGTMIVLSTLLTMAVILIFRHEIFGLLLGFITSRARLALLKLKTYFQQGRSQSEAAASDLTHKPVNQHLEVITPNFDLPISLVEAPPLAAPQEPFIGQISNAGEEASLPPETFAEKSSNKTNIAYTPPPTSIFQKSTVVETTSISAKEFEATANLLVKTFEDFGVRGKIVAYQPGPVVTVYEFQPDAGVKQAKVMSLIDDLALALKVDSIFINPVRGKRALGVQVPNTKREAVYLGDILSAPSFISSESPLTFGMGKTINGQPMCADLASMPHLLAAGATGSGKSVAINTLLCSIIMKSKPDEVRMILVDPKMLELSVYEGIPHLLMPVITEPTRASLALKWAANEMERRYKLMQHAAVRNIAGFNNLWSKASTDKKDELRQLIGDPQLDKLPYILLVIDELADLMLTAPKDVETSIQRLAQKARASGIHMVLATQRPSVDIITGVIKANLPCRIAFQVVSKHDSRTILDLIGAEKLLGKGDMLLQRPGIGRLERIQGALITDEEVLNLVATIKASSPAVYDDNIISWIDDELTRQNSSKESQDSEIAMDDDPKWDEAITLARASGAISASFLQRHLKIGYNRAARIVEFMESKGLVDKADGVKPRKWLGPVT